MDDTKGGKTRHTTDAVYSLERYQSMDTLFRLMFVVFFLWSRLTRSIIHVLI